MIHEQPAAPEGYQPLRLLSERTGSWVWLAVNPRSVHCCLKIQRLAHPDALDELAETRARLAPITGEPGFIPLLHWGFDRSALVLWEELALADDLMTLGVYSPDGAADYMPLTLASWISEHGRVSTRKVLEWGTQVAAGLARLHGRDLFHRDVKPANILIHGGKCVLGDYGSVGSAGSRIEFPGTEGFVPPDGMGSPALDIFALGRTLYEAWTGLDRFQFPSLPAAVCEAEDWETHGWQLNQILVKASDRRPSQRIQRSGDLRDELQRAQRSRKRVSRRKAIAGIAGVLASGTAAWIWKNHVPYAAVWTRVTPGRFGYEGFLPGQLTCDWKRRMLYSAFNDTKGMMIQRINLSDWSHREWTYPAVKNPIKHSCLTPDASELWAPEIVTGRIHRFSTETEQISTFPLEEIDLLGFDGTPYWNPITGRFGQFAGYGNFMVNNHRHEFDLPAGKWLKMEELSSDLPWPRLTGPMRFFPGPEREKWYLIGGDGNPSGKQAALFDQLKNYTGSYYPLNDLWELDLKRNAWRQLLPPQRWMPPGLVGGAYHHALRSLVFLTISETGARQPASLWLHDGAASSVPIRLPNRGDPIDIYSMWTILAEPSVSNLLVLAHEGVFSVTIESA
jgi:hypothetical protein